ncbi:hypothetical protein [Sinorhizobium fredii]|uniref:hypothetical protein n=1 Tax=Rhizobium fredii TaxID=380 RepID=UPI003514650B
MPAQTLQYIYRWDRQGRRGQPCDVLIRTKAMNSCLVKFADGYTMVTSRNAIMKNPQHPSFRIQLRNSK